MSKQAILFVFTSADKLIDGQATGWYLPEAAHPYYVLSPHFRLDAASPLGGKPPVDESSVKLFTDEESVKFLKEDPEAVKFWQNTKKIKDVKVEDYDAIFFIGGHGPMIDLFMDEDSIQLTAAFYAAKKPVAAVCHGPAALLQVPTPDGNLILNNIRVTGFSNSEEEMGPYAVYPTTLPYSLEDKMDETSGGKFEKNPENYGPHVVWDGGVLTGQNPASAGPLGQKLKEILTKA